MIKSESEKILAQLELSKFEELRHENILDEEQCAKLDEWTESIKKQIADFDDSKSSVEKEVGNVDAPFQEKRAIPMEVKKCDNLDSIFGCNNLDNPRKDGSSLGGSL